MPRVTSAVLFALTVAFLTFMTGPATAWNSQGRVVYTSLSETISESHHIQAQAHYSYGMGWNSNNNDWLCAPLDHAHDSPAPMGCAEVGCTGNNADAGVTAAARSGQLPYTTWVNNWESKNGAVYDDDDVTFDFITEDEWILWRRNDQLNPIFQQGYDPVPNWKYCAAIWNVSDGAWADIRVVALESTWP